MLGPHHRSLRSSTRRAALFGLGVAFLASAVPAGAAPPILKAAGPYAGLTLGKDGWLYGTTVFSAPGKGVGSVFRLKIDGTAGGVLTNFTGGYPYGKGNGASPRGALAVGPGSDPRLYGTAVTGGWSASFSAYGVVYAYSATAPRITDIHTFGEPPADESNSWSTLLLHTDGRFYGTTSTNPYGQRAAVFSITPAGAYHRLAQFPAASPTGGGVSSLAGLTRVGSYLYGVTTNGGSAGLGSVFRLPIAGGAIQTLHSFNGKDGADPRGELAVGGDGALYGTTYSGGTGWTTNTAGSGTVFRITTAGTFRKLVDFGAAPAKTGQAAAPVAGLTLNPADGFLYGTTSSGGTGGPQHSWKVGTVFRVSTGGAFVKLAEFSGTNGSTPTGRLLLHGGKFYGTTYSGGSGGAAYAPAGVVFRVTTGGVLTTLLEFDGN